VGVRSWCFARGVSGPCAPATDRGDVGVLERAEVSTSEDIQRNNAVSALRSALGWWTSSLRAASRTRRVSRAPIAPGIVTSLMGQVTLSKTPRTDRFGPRS
jgi:hypothetical protein